jgi:hypothetical protein
MTHPSNASAFRLSRICAEGWNDTRTFNGIDQANPYLAEPERGRWQAGFAGAQTSSLKKRS